MGIFVLARYLLKKYQAMSDDILKKIVQIEFPDSQYIKSETKKTQIYLHHTVSPHNSAISVSNYWKSTPERVATQIILNGDGIPYQLYSTKYWSYHLGLEEKTFNDLGLPYKDLSKISIGVEICSWGALIYHDDNKWYPIKWDKVQKKYVPHLKAGAIPENDVWLPPKNEFRGFSGFHKYTDEQIDTLFHLLTYWNKRWEIPLTYREEIFDIDVEALKGVPGVYTHCSVRKDKSDCYPDERLITMLKSL